MSNITRFLVKNYLPLVLTLSVGVLVFEIYDHTTHQHLFLTDLEFWFEVVTYGFVLPILGIFLMQTLKNYQFEREQATQYLDVQLQFRQRMTRSTTWDQLVDSIVGYPGQILPVVQTSLHTNNKGNGVFTLAGFWRQDGIVTSPPPAALSTQEHLQLYAASDRPNLFSCNSRLISGDPSVTDRYCLPIHNGEDLIAILHLELLAGTTIPSAKVRYLTDNIPEISLMLIDDKFSKKNNNPDESLRNYRKQVAQDLHDTLGQNISYLRLKCDMLIEDGDLQKVTDVRQELQRMREAADQAYEQMRLSLEQLNPSSSVDLIALLRNQAERIAQRASLQADVTSHCSEFTVSPELFREIGMVFGEAIHNIEKHAEAENVVVQLYQESDGLYIQIEDDGIGFDINNVYFDNSQNGHYGLASMHERVERLNGELMIKSVLGGGTTITIHIPLNDELIEGV